MNQPVPYVREAELKEIVKRLGKNITADYPPDTVLVVVVVLKGAMLFAADLVREIQLPVKLDFVRLASYGSGTESSGEVRILKDIEMDPRGKDLLVIDDIFDSGRSLGFLLNRLQSQGPKSLKLCTLLDKPSRRKVHIQVDYIGKVVEDKFLVGYGLDFDEKFRNLKDVCVIE